MLATARIATTPSATVTDAWVGDELSFWELEPEWNELLQTSESNCLFLTWEWLSTWWKHLADDRRLAILALRCGGELAAVAPCYVRPADWQRVRPVPVMEFLGSGYVGSDYLDIIVRAGYKERARSAIVSRLASRRMAQKWTQLRSDAYAESVACGLSQAGWTVDETIINQLFGSAGFMRSGTPTGKCSELRMSARRSSQITLRTPRSGNIGPETPACVEKCSRNA